eukprot:1372678-Prymnesium_polylepis.1
MSKGLGDLPLDDWVKTLGGLHATISCISDKSTREPGQTREHKSARGGKNGPVHCLVDGLNDPVDVAVLGDHRADHLGAGRTSF